MMKIRNVLASIAAAGLVIAPIAAQAGTRASLPVGMPMIMAGAAAAEQLEADEQSEEGERKSRRVGGYFQLFGGSMAALFGALLAAGGLSAAKSRGTGMGLT